MLELTREECTKLEETVVNELCSAIQDDAYSKLYRVIAETAVRAAITTIREYERMKQTG